MNEAIDRAQQMLDVALQLADGRSWESLRLHEVATAMGITLDEIREHYREKEDLVEAWFDRADSAALRDAATIEFQSLPTRERLHRIIMTWLQALAKHRRVTRQMIINKLEPGHLHFQIPALMRISRTVQWMREGAGLSASLPRRALEEAGLTSIYLATFICWMRDESPGSDDTRRFLDKLLTAADRFPLGGRSVWQT
ncbi:MAG: TetR/AcrR family transcriptional regulator [Gammaproteobacteria bacterium]